jgi:hypothetical protein
VSSLEFQAVVFCHERWNSDKEAQRLARSVVLDDHGRQVWLLAPPKNLCIPSVIAY